MCVVVFSSVVMDTVLSHRPQVVAACHASGHVIVWRLSSQLATLQQGEEKILEDIANRTFTV